MKSSGTCFTWSLSFTKAFGVSSWVNGFQHSLKVLPIYHILDCWSISSLSDANTEMHNIYHIWNAQYIYHSVISWIEDAQFPFKTWMVRWFKLFQRYLKLPVWLPASLGTWFLQQPYHQLQHGCGSFCPTWTCYLVFAQRWLCSSFLTKT